MRSFRVFATLLLALTMSINVFGQATGSLSGTVQDGTGALIPGVEVTAVNDGTGVETTVISNETGTYDFAAIPPGTYTVRASLTGFQTRTFTLVSVLPSSIK